MIKPRGFSSRFGFAMSLWSAATMRALVDAFFAGRLATLEARQEAHLAANGRYWQGLDTHAARPAHATALDASAQADRMGSAPTDQAETWADFIPEWAGELPARARVDVYDGPAGKGWTLTLEVSHDGDLWVRVANFGPEAHRARAWAPVQPPGGVEG